MFQALRFQQASQASRVEAVGVARELPEQRLDVGRELLFGRLELTAFAQAYQRGEHAREILDQATQQIALGKRHAPKCSAERRSGE